MSAEPAVPGRRSVAASTIMCGAPTAPAASAERLWPEACIYSISIVSALFKCNLFSASLGKGGESQALGCSHLWLKLALRAPASHPPVQRATPGSGPLVGDSAQNWHGEQPAGSLRGERAVPCCFGRPGRNSTQH